MALTILEKFQNLNMHKVIQKRQIMAFNFKTFPQMSTSVRLTIHVRMGPLVLTMLVDISVCVPQDIKENNVIKVKAAFFLLVI